MLDSHKRSSHKFNPISIAYSRSTSSIPTQVQVQEVQFGTLLQSPFRNSTAISHWNLFEKSKNEFKVQSNTFAHGRAKTDTEIDQFFWRNVLLVSNVSPFFQPSHWERYLYKIFLFRINIFPESFSVSVES